jgi:hypothetical protein
MPNKVSTEMNEIKLFYVLFIITVITSCSTFSGERSLGKNLVVIEGKKDEDRKIVYCPDKKKSCSEGMKIIPTNDSEHVEAVTSNDEWIIARTVEINGKRESYWIINKDFSLGDQDCGTTDCGDYIKTYVSGPLSLEDFEGHKNELKIELYLPATEDK